MDRRPPIDDALPMEAVSAEHLPEGDGWWFEPKWDGFRCLAFRRGNEVRLKAKSGKPLGRYFPEVTARLAEIDADPVVLDGELLIADAGAFSFEALQQRLHPAESRIRRLAAESPAVLAVFDLLQAPDGRDLRDRPLSERRAALEALVERCDAPILQLTPGTRDRGLAQSWLDGGKVEGVIAKGWNEPYRDGERAMVKVKRLRTADCVVGGFRYAASGDVVGSLLLGLYDAQGLLNHVGHAAGLAALDKAALTRRLEELRGGVSFTGSAPGGPSRWSSERSGEWVSVRPEIVVEVSFDHVSADRFRHGTRFIRFRPDKAPKQCRMDQLSG